MGGQRDLHPEAWKCGNSLTALLWRGLTRGLNSLPKGLLMSVSKRVMEDALEELCNPEWKLGRGRG